MNDIDRRVFLFALAAPLYPTAPLRVLSAGDAKLVEALCAQIVPADDAPGAKEAGVLFYIDAQLAGPLARYTDEYRKGVPALNAFSREQGGADFAELSFSKQTELLTRIQAQRGSELDGFFQLVIDHTMQGFYGSPKHGGNKDEASWRMLGITDVMEGHKH